MLERFSIVVFSAKNDGGVHFRKKYDLGAIQGSNNVGRFLKNDLDFYCKNYVSFRDHCRTCSIFVFDHRRWGTWAQRPPRG